MGWENVGWVRGPSVTIAPLREPSMREVIEALGITAYDKTDDDGRTYTDAAAFASDIRDTLALKRESETKTKRAAAAERLAGLGA